MSKANAPMRKVEYRPPRDIELVRDDILKEGLMLKSVIGMKFPDAEKVSNAIGHLLGVAMRYKLVGKWVSSVTTKEIRDVSTFMYSFFLICHINV